MYTLIKESKMSEDKKCFCQSEGVRKFCVVALGSFVGVFCAINLFAALNKPPMMPPMPMMNPPMYQTMEHHRHDCNCPCHKKMLVKPLDKKADFEKLPPIEKK